MKKMTARSNPQDKMAYSILSRNNALLIDVAEISNYVL
jgi:hypothetical protein